MDWLNIHTSVLDSAEFLTAEPVDRGTWLCLQRYCCGQENGGRITGAGSWTDRIWQQLAGVTLKEVRHSCQLWDWETDDLVVRFYNVETERKVQNNRKVGSAGGHASAAKRLASKAGQAHAASESQAHGSSIPQPHGSSEPAASGDTKGKERERNGREGNTPYPQGGGQQGSGSTTSRPARQRQLKSGSILLSEQPEDLRLRLQAVGVLMRRQAGTPWSARELEAFRASRLDDCAAAEFEAQLEPLREYYHAKISGEKDIRRRDLQTLLNNWTGELDRARAWARDHNDGIQKL